MARTVLDGRDQTILIWWDSVDSERDQIAVWNFQTGNMEMFLISPEVMQMRP